jgi:hypothetical protein
VILNAIGGSILAFAVGVGVGVVTTLAHRAYPVDLGVPIPLGLVVGLVIVALLLLGFRLVFEGRLYTIAAAGGVVVAVAVLAYPGLAGSVLVIDDAIGYVWVLGSVLIAGVAVALPAPRARH